MKVGKLYKIKGNLNVSFGNSLERRLMIRTWHPGERVNIDHSCSWLEDGAIVLLVELRPEHLSVVLPATILFMDQLYIVPVDRLEEL